MKKIVLLFTALFFTSMIAWGVGFVEPIQVNYNNGIYHIIIDGKKEAKNINFVSSI